MPSTEHRRDRSLSSGKGREHRERRRRSPSSSSNDSRERRHRRSHKDDREENRSQQTGRYENGERHRSRPSRPDRSVDDHDRTSRAERPESARKEHRRKYRSRSRDIRDRSRSPIKKRRRSRSRSREARSPPRKSRSALPSQDECFRGEKQLEGGAAPPPPKEKPNYKPTGLLAKEANTVTGTTTVLKYHEPAEARKPPPKEQWRMYVFKKKDLLDTVYLHQRSVWLFGRDQAVTDMLLEHPSISKQHAVVQFRYLTSTNEYGDKTSKVKPYLIDLESANGTKLNGKKIEASRYVELVDGDVVVFGDSEREYVMMLPPP